MRDGNTHVLAFVWEQQWCISHSNPNDKIIVTHTLSEFPGAAVRLITVNLGTQNNRNIFFHGSGGQKSEMRGQQGRAVSGSSRGPCTASPLSVSGVAGNP